MMQIKLNPEAEKSVDEFEKAIRYSVFHLRKVKDTLKPMQKGYLQGLEDSLFSVMINLLGNCGKLDKLTEKQES